LDICKKTMVSSGGPWSFAVLFRGIVNYTTPVFYSGIYFMSAICENRTKSEPN